MIAHTVEIIRRDISSICASCGRDPAHITVVAASKGRSPEQVRQVIDAGVRDLGENRVQETLKKYTTLGQHYRERIRLHMIGHLQRNKVKDAVAVFDVIQSVDSLSLAEEIDKQAQKLHKIQDVLIEIKVSEEQTKYGFLGPQIRACILSLCGLRNLCIKGFMALAPQCKEKEETRIYFRNTKRLFDEINVLFPPAEKMSIVSMGMTDDFSIAIQEGSTMIRLGRAIFDGVSL